MGNMRRADVITADPNVSVPIGSLIFPLAADAFKLYHGYAGSSVEDVSSKLLAENSPVQAEATAAGTLHNAINTEMINQTNSCCKIAPGPGVRPIQAGSS